VSLTRRQFIWTTAASAVVWPDVLRGQTPAAGDAIFQHGVASGDPLAERVILWTRVTPRGGPAMDVQWRIAGDPALTQIVNSGTARAAADRDFTVKVDAGGLQPGRTYYYAFDAAGERSPIGRTKTLPEGLVNRVRFAVVSCANYPAGYFNVYRCVANRTDLDVVLHVGDYIYEFQNGTYGDGAGLLRMPQPPRETVSLTDYRVRYATYRADPDLQAVHQQHPFIAVWDDHELTNDAWLDGAANHNPAEGEGDWPTRRAAAYRAYLEWMPIREARTTDVRLYRDFRFGTLVDLVMLDTRGLRDQQVAADDLEGLIDPGRSLLGAAQESWLFDRLRTSQQDRTAWRVLGQQIMFSRVAPPGFPVPLPDLWDGYQAARDRVLDTIASEKITDVAILAGDLHSSWACEVPRTWGGRSMAVEFVTPAVSSPPFFANPQARERAPVLRALLQHVKYLEGDGNGYLVVDITPAQLRGDWFHVPGVLERSAAEARAAGFVCERGSARLAPA
jgi:alkaline phosphatase D